MNTIAICWSHTLFSLEFKKERHMVWHGTQCCVRCQVWVEDSWWMREASVRLLLGWREVYCTFVEWNHDTNPLFFLDTFFSQCSTFGTPNCLTWAHLLTFKQHFYEECTWLSFTHKGQATCHLVLTAINCWRIYHHTHFNTIQQSIPTHSTLTNNLLPFMLQQNSPTSFDDHPSNTPLDTSRNLHHLSLKTRDKDDEDKQLLFFDEPNTGS